MANRFCPSDSATTSATSSTNLAELAQYEEVPRFRVALIHEPGFSCPEPTQLTQPEQVAALVWKLLHDADREHFGAIYLDVRQKVIGYQIAYIGTLTRASVEPRGVFTAALLCNAASLILFHCHPSGDPTPGRRDTACTESMIRAGEFLRIPVVDHVILGNDGRWFSFRQNGML